MTGQRIVGDVRRALGYLVEAARLLRRHPSLLLLPVVVAVFNAAEGSVGRDLMIQRTEYGRWLQERARELPPQPPPHSRVRVVRVEMPSGIDVPYLPLTGTGSLIGAVVEGRPRHAAVSSLPGGGFRIVALAVALSLLVLIPLNALVRGGYFGLLAGAVSADKAGAACFARSAGRFFLRFWLLLALLGVAYIAFFSIASSVLGRSTLGWALLRGASCPMVAGVFFLMLVSSALVWEDSSVWTSLTRSASMAARDVGIAVPLLVVAIVAEEAVSRLFVWVRYWTWQEVDPAGFVLWGNLLTDAGHRCVLALVGAWLVVAVMLWYRDASARLWPRAAEDSAPTAAEG